MPLSFTWSIAPLVAPVDAARAPTKPLSNLITGLARPFRRTERDFASASGDALILSEVAQVLGTVRGTLPWQPSFGSDLNRLRHKKNSPILKETARVYVDDALRKWVPTAALVLVQEPTNVQGNEIDLSIVVQIGNKQQALTQRL